MSLLVLKYEQSFQFDFRDIGMEDIQDARNKIGEISNQVGRTITQFIQKQCPRFKEDEITKYTQHYIFRELVSNSFDSHQASENQEKIFKLRVVIKEDPCAITIKFKDFGKGFPKIKKGEREEIKQGEYKYNEQKDPAKKVVLGGQGIGLSRYIEFINRLGGKVEVKNRKEAGCSVEAIFPKKKKVNNG